MLDNISAQVLSPMTIGPEPGAARTALQPLQGEGVAAARSQAHGEDFSGKASVNKEDRVRISEEAREIARLAARDREVRTHEAAHAAVGGRYAGVPSLTYTRGPDGRSYARGGEVSIDLSPVSGDPQASLQKAQVIRAAALAPAQPSGQDKQIAARASAMAARASAELASEKKVPAREVEGDAAAAEDSPATSDDLSPV